MFGGMFGSSASPAIPQRKSFATIPSVSLVLLGHTNRNVSVSHESQRELLSSFRHFQDRFLTANKEKLGENERDLVSQGWFFF